MNRLFNKFYLAFLFFSLSCYAEDLKEQFGATLGGSYEYGQLGDSGMGLQDRSMNAVAIEFLPGYRLNSEWLIGVDINYRIQRQISSLNSSGGTNLAGKGYLVGLGAKYTLSPSWSLQGALNFFGRYEFDRQTDQQQDDHLHSPLNLRFKMQYFFRDNLPLSIDGVLDYQSWGKFHVSGVDHSDPAKQWMVGVGLTYHFGNDPAVEIKPMAVAPVEVAKVKVEEKIHIEGTAFNSSSAELSQESFSQIKEIGEKLAKNPKAKVLVKGYTDSSGRADKNKKLSLDRAISVKKALTAGGVSSDSISIEGLADRDPIADNSTPEGRAKNRRVEIQVQEKP